MPALPCCATKGEQACSRCDQRVSREIRRAITLRERIVPRAPGAPRAVVESETLPGRRVRLVC